MYQVSDLKLKLNTTNCQSLNKLCSVLKMAQRVYKWNWEEGGKKSKMQIEVVNSCPFIVNFVSIDTANDVHIL